MIDRHIMVLFIFFLSLAFAICQRHLEMITALEERVEDLEKYIYDEE